MAQYQHEQTITNKKGASKRVAKHTAIRSNCNNSTPNTATKPISNLKSQKWWKGPTHLIIHRLTKRNFNSLEWSSSHHLPSRPSHVFSHIFTLLFPSSPSALRVLSFTFFHPLHRIRGRRLLLHLELEGGIHVEPQIEVDVSASRLPDGPDQHHDHSDTAGGSQSQPHHASAPGVHEFALHDAGEGAEDSVQQHDRRDDAVHDP